MSDKATICSIIYQILLLSTAVSSSVFDDCPKGWLTTTPSRCLLFVWNRRLGFADASVYCHHKLARLFRFAHSPRQRTTHTTITNDTHPELNAIKTYLANRDFVENTWWYDDGTADSNQTRMGLSYHNGSVSRVVQSSTAENRFICQAGGIDLPGMRTLERLQNPLEFGQDLATALRKDYPPIITDPPDNIVYYPVGHTQTLALYCATEARPPARIRWYSGSGGLLVDLSKKKRLLEADGTLLFTDFTSKEIDSYYCTATNYLGTVRSAKATVSAAYVETFPRARLDVYGIAGLGKSVSCDEPEHYPDSLTFAWIFGSVKDLVKEDERIFISKDGRLYFAYLVEEDAASIACSIVSPQLQSGHYGPFFNLIVTTAEAGVASQFRPEIADNFIKVFPHHPRIGTPVRLECFAFGRPAPSYEWSTVDGRPLPEHLIENHGRVLRIHSFAVNHAGAYRCTAKNQLGVDVRDVTVSFGSAPIVLGRGLEDQSGSVGSRILFEFTVFARPEARFEWFHDGVPISPLLLPPADQRRISVLGNKLSIEDAQRRDSGVYQCIATNHFGTMASQGAYLSIKDFRPDVSRGFVRSRVYATTGKSARLQCVHQSSPTPLRSIWKFGGFEIAHGGRFAIHPNGTLLIREVLATDDGSYVCTVINDNGADSARIHLTVLSAATVVVRRSRIKVESQPRDGVVCEVVQSKCGHQRSTETCPEPMIKLYRNGIAVNRLPPSVIAAVTEGKYSYSLHFLQGLDDLHPKDNFTCCASFGEQRMTRQLSAVNLEDAKPLLAPVNLTVSDIRSSGFRVSWRLSPFGVKPEYFIIRLTNTADQIDLVTVKTRKLKRKLIGLLPGMMYNASITAHIGRRRVSKRASRFSVKTLENKPLATVRNLTAVRLSNGDISVSWKPLRIANRGSMNVSYVLRFSTNDTAKIPTEQLIPSGWNRFTIPARRLLVTPPNRRHSCQHIVVALVAVNLIGFGPVAQTTVPTPTDTANENFDDLIDLISVGVLNATTVQMIINESFWSNDTCAYNKPFTVELSCASQQNDVHIHGIALRFQTLLYLPIRKTGTYHCNVTTLRVDGAVIDTRALTLATPKCAPIEAPVLLGVTTLHSKVKLNWNPAKFDPNLEEPVQGFKIYVYDGATSHVPAVLTIPLDSQQLSTDGFSPSLASSNLAVMLSGFRQMHLYRIQIAAYSQGGIGALSASRSFRFADYDSDNVVDNDISLGLLSAASSNLIAHQHSVYGLFAFVSFVHSWHVCLLQIFY